MPHLRSRRLAERQQEQFLRTADLLDQKVDGTPGESASFARARPRNNAQRAAGMTHHFKLLRAKFGGEMVDLGCDGHGDGLLWVWIKMTQRTRAPVDIL